MACQKQSERLISNLLIRHAALAVLIAAVVALPRWGAKTVSATTGRNSVSNYGPGSESTGGASSIEKVPGAAGSSPRNIVATSDRVYFTDDITSTTKQHLWKTDGQSVKLIETASKEGGVFDSIHQLIAVGGTLYFTEDEHLETSGDDSVWQTTATANSLRRLANVEQPQIIVKDPTSGPAKRVYFYEPGSRNGTVAAIFSAKDGKVTAFIPFLEPDPDKNNNAGIEGIAADEKGNVYGGSTKDMTLTKFVKGKGAS